MGNNWHMIIADFHLGDDENGRPRRKKLVAMLKTDGRLTVEWQRFPHYPEATEPSL